MFGYEILALVLFVILVAVFLIRYVNLTVDVEFQNLAKAASDPEYRASELDRADRLLASLPPVAPAEHPPEAPMPAWMRTLPPVLLCVGVILLWGALFVREEKSKWLWGGVVSTVLAAGLIAPTLKRRKGEHMARWLRYRADLRRMDKNRAGAAADLQRLVGLTPWDDAAWAELAEDLWESDRRAEAIGAAREAVRRDPEYEDYRQLLVSLLLRNRDTAAARTALKEWDEAPGVDFADPLREVFRAAIALADGERQSASRFLGGIAERDEVDLTALIDSDPAFQGLAEIRPATEKQGEGR